jgi:methanogen homocitrate synthase
MEHSNQDGGTKKLIRFYDSTLRDGEQMPGVAFDRPTRIRIAKALDSLGIDELDIGIAASGKKQLDDMIAIVESGLRARTLSLARPIRGDILASKQSGVDGIILIASCSDIHLRYKLNTTALEVTELLKRAVALAREEGLFVEVGFEDATRTPTDRLVDISLAVERCGAERIGLADTLGVGTPQGVHAMVKAVGEAVNLPVAVHCHDDFGLAVANSLAAVGAGARVLSTTVNGIGERSGNAATEVCAVALQLLYGFNTNIDLEKVMEVSRLVYASAKLAVPPNRPVTGINSFRHESGMHVAALLRDSRTYEAYPPSLVGGERQIVLGKTTGRAAVRHFTNEIAKDLSDLELARVTEEVQALAEKTGSVGLSDLRNIVEACRKAAVH